MGFGYRCDVIVTFIDADHFASPAALVLIELAAMPTYH